MSIGTVLKEARVKKEITLEDVHAKIKIHPRVLQLLEEEKFEKLPSPLFAKSFLKSYAQFLEVNADELLENYEKENQVAEPEQRLYLKPADMSGSRKIPVPWLAGGLAAVFVLVAVLSGAPSKWAAGWAAHAKTSATKAEKSRAAKEKKAQLLRLEEAEEKSTIGWLSSVKLGNFPKLNKRQPLELQIKALEAVWVHITADGKVLFQGVLKKSGAQTWKGKESIEIWTGNASNMSLELNGQALGSPGKGVVKKMIVSHEGIRIASPSDG